MADVLLPFDSEFADYDMGFTLPDTGVAYVGALKFNARAGNKGMWFFELQDVTGDPIVSGIACVLGALLGHRCKDPRFPPGVFTMVDFSDQDIDAGIDDLGTRVVMYYTPNTDLDGITT